MMLRLNSYGHVKLLLKRLIRDIFYLRIISLKEIQKFVNFANTNCDFECVVIFAPRSVLARVAQWLSSHKGIYTANLRNERKEKHHKESILLRTFLETTESAVSIAQTFLFCGLTAIARYTFTNTVLIWFQICSWARIT